MAATDGSDPGWRISLFCLPKGSSSPPCTVIPQATCHWETRKLRLSVLRYFWGTEFWSLVMGKASEPLFVHLENEHDDSDTGHKVSTNIPRGGAQN